MQIQAQSSAFLYPGQGVITHDICAYFLLLKSADKKKTEEYVKIAQSALDAINPEAHFVISQLLENETAAPFQQTSFTQPVTYMLSALTHDILHAKDYRGYKPSIMLGHSLGAFSALTASGSVPFEQGCQIVAARGKFMQEESEKSDTGMVVVLGLPEDKVAEICQMPGAIIALKNGPTAFVIGAPRNIFSEIEQQAIRRGARKVFPLETSGAFHTPYMQGAYEKFKYFLAPYTFLKPHVPVVTNIDGKGTRDPQVLKKDVIESMIQPVNWIRMMNFVKSTSVTAYVEAGPGASMTSLCRINDIPREQTLSAGTLISEA